VAREQEERDTCPLRARPNPSTKLKTVEGPKLRLRDHQIGKTALELLQGELTAADSSDFIACLAEARLQHPKVVGISIDDNQARFAGNRLQDGSPRSFRVLAVPLTQQPGLSLADRNRGQSRCSGRLSSIQMYK
jgi:hypothetical protein